MARVTMNLEDEDLKRVERLRKALDLSTRTGTVIQSIRIVDYLVTQLAEGKELALLSKGKGTERIAIPGLRLSS